ncbi:MAG: hypothetical protein BYD32DRAFT_427417 [Podila humilis]|nr:MAG: hypothetical protein BYD32DRAFT_427417 [Podila humilis]
MSKRELRQLNQSASVEVNSPRMLRTRRNTAPSSASKEHQDTVFSIPELQTNILVFLIQEDLKALMLTCRAWSKFCVPALYKRISLMRHSHTRHYPNIEKYGSHVRHLRLDSTNVQDTLPLVVNTPHLRQLELLRSKLTSSQLDTVLSSVSTEVSHFRAQLISRSSHHSRAPWFREPMFHSVAHLRNLRSLHWASVGMTIHVDEILRVLQACPQLASLNFGMVHVAYIDGNDSIADLDEHCIDPPGPLEPIPDTDLDALYSGRQLQELVLNGTLITDESLLRLLGIDLEPVDDDRAEKQRRIHALVRLDVYSHIPTYKSGARILQECGRLEVLKLRTSKLATLGLFQGDASWPSAPLIKELRLDIKGPTLDSIYYYHHQRALDEGIPVFSAKELYQIWSRLQAMVSLQLLEISGYPVDFAMVENMSFAKQLESASVKLTFRVPNEQMESEKLVLAARAEEWMARNPEGWSYSFDESFMFAGPKLELTYRKN